MQVINRHSQKRKTGSKGQSLVEFALILPMILLLTLGAMDIGRLFFTKMVLVNAAREGANYLAYFPEDKNYNYVGTYSAIENEGLSSTVEIVTPDDVVISSDCCTTGNPVKVTVTKTVDLILAGLLQGVGILNGEIQLSSSVEMVVQ